MYVTTTSVASAVRNYVRSRKERGSLRLGGSTRGRAVARRLESNNGDKTTGLLGLRSDQTRLIRDLMESSVSGRSREGRRMTRNASDAAGRV